MNHVYTQNLPHYLKTKFSPQMKNLMENHLEHAECKYLFQNTYTDTHKHTQTQTDTDTDTQTHTDTDTDTHTHYTLNKYLTKWMWLTFADLVTYVLTYAQLADGLVFKPGARRPKAGTRLVSRNRFCAGRVCMCVCVCPPPRAFT